MPGNLELCRRVLAARAHGRAAALVLACYLASACGSERAREDDGALVVLLPRDAIELDPRLTGDAYGHKISRLLFSSLVSLDGNTLEVVPDLAERVDVLDASRYRVRLRAGLRFSDGSTLDAQDVRATFHSVTHGKLGSRYAETYRRIANIVIEDAATLRFELDGPHATFLTDLELPIVRSEDADRQLGALGSRTTVSSGPFALERRVDGFMALVPNPHWHGSSTRPARVHMRVVRDDNTRALRLLAGAGDVALNAVPPLLLPLFEKGSGDAYRVESVGGVGTTYVGINLEAPALKDRRVRAALGHAIDRAALIRTKLDSRARLAGSFIVPGHWARLPNDDGLAYDPERAAELLDAAGLRARDGTRLRLSMRCSSDRGRLSLARAITAMLGRVGVAVDLRPSETATLLHDLDRGSFELVLLQVPEVVEPHVLSWFFGSDRIPEGLQKGANRWRLRSPELDRALEQGRRSAERDARVAAYHEAQRILSEALPIIPLWHEDVVLVTSARARGVRPSRLGRFDGLLP